MSAYQVVKDNIVCPDKAPCPIAFQHLLWSWTAAASSVGFGENCLDAQDEGDLGKVNSHQIFFLLGALSLF